MVEILAVDPDKPSRVALRRASSVLGSGGLLIYPTDTLYAVGGRGLDPAVAAAVRAAKGRPEAMPLPLVASDLEQARSLCRSWTPLAERLGSHFWPGPLSLVLPVGAGLPRGVSAGTDRVAVRVPDSVLVRSLCLEQGPLVSTSANVTGQTPPSTCAEAVAAVGSAVALAIDGGPGSPVASTLVDVSGDAPRELRPGAIAWDRVRTVWLESGSC
jgi:tRNA threonylcarbamoyl adenosine modification protein (Sua5/YciO/YrdC/YwlC family)